MSDLAGPVHIVENEYASVSVGVDDRGNDPRLVLLDNRSGQRTYLDALTLEALVWLPDDLRDRLLDPSLHRWASEPVDGV